MKQKIKKSVPYVIIFVLLCALVFSIIGSPKSQTDSFVDKETYEESYDGDYGFLADNSINSSVGSPSTEGTNSPAIKNETLTENNGTVITQKIIKNYNFSIETQDFDKSLTEIEKLVSKYNGYIENSKINADNYSDYRYANMTIRIPVKEENAFLETVNNNFIILSKETDTDDITGSYIDTESRIKALKIEKESLERLLAKAETVSDILIVQNQLTDVISEIERCEKTIKTYDNLVSYITIRINLSEVEKPTVIEERSVWQQISDLFNESIDDIKENLTEFIVFFVGNILYFVIFAGVLLIVCLIGKKIKKKKQRKLIVSETKKQDK